MKITISHLTAYLRRIIAVVALIAGVTAISSCNSKEDNPDSPVVTTNINAVAITQFNLQADPKIALGLDSVFFSIDLNQGIIFNADSLPVGTDITKLKTKITFYNAVSEAKYTMENGTLRTGESDYRSTPNDTIDFSGDVMLRVVSNDGGVTMNYRIKVNVHKMNPDSLAWSEMEKRQLPARLDNPRRQKTVAFKDGVVSIIEESDASWTIAKAESPSQQWSSQNANLPFTPKPETLTASTEALYILSTDGSLFTSADAQSWSDTGCKWLAISGGYDKYVLGVISDANGARHTFYPSSDALSESPLESDFPITATSTFTTFSSKWNPLPTGILVGGRNAEGNVVGDTWAFDGVSWAQISENPLPAMEGVTLFPYLAYGKIMSSMREYSVWLAIGGRNADGSLNRITYISYDNGINWRAASQSLMLPDFIPSTWMADVVISNKLLSASLSGWAKQSIAPRYPACARVKHSTDGEIINWECPYIYLFGGFNAEGMLVDAIWKGALNRLTFKPII